MFTQNVQAQFMSNDPDYLSCKKEECKKYSNGVCVLTTCSGSLSFHVINIRTDIDFVLFAGGFGTPCILKRSNSLSFANPQKPLYGHLSSVDSTGTSVSRHSHICNSLYTLLVHVLYGSMIAKPLIEYMVLLL